MPENKTSGFFVLLEGRSAGRRRFQTSSIDASTFGHETGHLVVGGRFVRRRRFARRRACGVCSAC